MAVSYDRIFANVCRVPYGRVATYAQIARLSGCSPRSVGYALSALKDDAEQTPWHRVVNSQGRISPRNSGDGDKRQVKLLRKEGVRVSRAGVIKLDEFGWVGNFEEPDFM